jgi:hypothetical protein
VERADTGRRSASGEFLQQAPPSRAKQNPALGCAGLFPHANSRFRSRLRY